MSARSVCRDTEGHTCALCQTLQAEANARGARTDTPGRITPPRIMDSPSWGRRTQRPTMYRGLGTRMPQVSIQGQGAPWATWSPGDPTCVITMAVALRAPAAHRAPSRVGYPL